MLICFIWTDFGPKVNRKINFPINKVNSTNKIKDQLRVNHEKIWSKCFASFLFYYYNSDKIRKYRHLKKKFEKFNMEEIQNLKELKKYTIKYNDAEEKWMNDHQMKRTQLSKMDIKIGELKTLIDLENNRITKIFDTFDQDFDINEPESQLIKKIEEILGEKSDDEEHEKEILELKKEWEEYENEINDHRRGIIKNNVESDHLKQSISIYKKSLINSKDSDSNKLNVTSDGEYCTNSFKYESKDSKIEEVDEDQWENNESRIFKNNYIEPVYRFKTNDIKSTSNSYLTSTNLNTTQHLTNSNTDSYIKAKMTESILSKMNKNCEDEELKSQAKISNIHVSNNWCQNACSIF